MELFEHFMESWNDPAMRHAILAHFPVVLSILGVPAVIVAAIAGGRWQSLRWLALALFLVLAACGFVTRNSGEWAHDAVRGSVSEEAHEVLEEHEELGEKVWMFAAGVSVLLAVSFIGKPIVRWSAVGLAVLGSLATAGWVGNTAEHGGRLVYDHGTGVATGGMDWLEAAGETAAPDDDPRLVFFRAEIRPLLVEHCMRCHNPKRQKRSGGLNQTTIAGLLAGGESGPAIVPGGPGSSLIIQRVTAEDEDDRMPPDEELTAGQIEALRRWISEGAVWEAPPAEPEEEPVEPSGEVPGQSGGG